VRIASYDRQRRGQRGRTAACARIEQGMGTPRCECVRTMRGKRGGRYDELAVGAAWSETSERDHHGGRTRQLASVHDQRRESAAS
jgi:hypothetical protein